AFDGFANDVDVVGYVRLLDGQVENRLRAADEEILARHCHHSRRVGVCRKFPRRDRVNSGAGQSRVGASPTERGKRVRGSIDTNYDVVAHCGILFESSAPIARPPTTLRSGRSSRPGSKVLSAVATFEGGKNLRTRERRADPAGEVTARRVVPDEFRVTSTEFSVELGHIGRWAADQVVALAAKYK